MKLILSEDEIIDMLIYDYDVDDMDAHDAVIAAKALDIIEVGKSTQEMAEKIIADKRCW